MKLHTKGSCKKKSLAIALSLACSISLAHAAPDTSKNTQEFLSDPSRVGSLAGTILGGALTAHPVGTLAGSIVGFFIGKQSMFKSTEQKAQAQQQYARRSIIPSEPLEAQIALETATPSITDEQAEIQDDTVLALSSETTGLPYQEPARASDISNKDTAPPISSLEQIAALCQGKHSDISHQALQSLCYYRQSS